MWKIINIVNFVRASEPRCPERDLLLPLREEIALNEKYGYDNTILVQYDAMISPDFQPVIKAAENEHTEIGVWFECVRQLVEKCGMEWRGSPDVTWDWHIIPGFLMAYTTDERRMLIDEFMNSFRRIFGHYPLSVGSWIIDSFSARYMSEKYHVRAIAICREQYGVDAYTLWGGYFNQGYYPSKNNILCTGQTEENTLKTPVFRMLGPDPIYSYNENEFDDGINAGCATMEPVWKYGGSREIMQDLLDSYYREECMDFAYTTIGQENSFGWEHFGENLKVQYELIDDMCKNGEAVIKKLSDTGEWFCERFSQNPQVSLISHRDRAENGLAVAWYNCKNYRAALFKNGNKLYFRDINVFDECVRERYFDRPCETMTAYYDNLPVVDGRLWSGGGITPGLKFDTEYQH